MLALGQPLPGFPHGTLHERIEAMDRLAAEHPRSAEPVLRRAELHREHGDYDLALADIWLAEELEPELPRVDLHRARVYRDQGQAQKAREATLRFLARVDGDTQSPQPIASARQLLADLDTQSGDALSAAHQLSLAIEASEHPAPALFLRCADAFEDAGVDYFDEALATLDRGLDALGPLVVLQQRALRVEMARGNLDAALGRIDAIVASTPGSPESMLQRGRILERMGRPNEALASYHLGLRALLARPPARQQAPAALSLRAELDQAIERLSDRLAEAQTAHQSTAHCPQPNACEENN